MIERHIPRHRIPVTACRCGRPPRAFQSRGTASVVFSGKPSTAYFFECAPCFLRTAKLNTLAAAGAAWNAQHIASFTGGEHATPAPPDLPVDRTVTAMRR